MADRSGNLWISTGAVFGFLSVAFGAFGAHALAGKLDDKSLALFQTATHYLIFHALALTAWGLWTRQNPKSSQWPGWAFTIGILLFSGSLYALALSGIRGLGAITPIGGISFLAGWAGFARAAHKAG